MKIKIIVFVLFFAILYSTSGFAEEYNLTTCATLNESANYYLMNNITTSANCFDIIADAVVFDCQDYTMTGDGTGNGIYMTGVDNVTIKNCNIDYFYANVNAEILASNISLINIFSKRSMGVSFRFYNATNIYAKDLTAKDDAYYGLIFVVGSHNLTVNNFTGIHCGSNCLETGVGAYDVSLEDLKFYNLSTNYINGIVLRNGNNFNVDGVQCYNLGFGENCIYLENTTNVSIRNVYENKIHNSYGFGIYFCDSCGTNSSNIVIRNVVFNGIWTTSNNKDSGAARIVNANNVYVENITTNKTRWSVLFGTIDTGEITDVHAENCRLNIQVGTWGGGFNRNIKVHDINDVKCGYTMYEDVRDSEIWNLNYSQDTANTGCMVYLVNSTMHDNYFNGECYFTGSNVTLKNNTFAKYLIWQYTDAYGYGFTNHSNDIDASNKAGDLPLYYFENRTTDITSLNTHNMLCMGCNNMEMKDMDLGTPSLITFFGTDNFTMRNISVSGHSAFVGSNATIIGSRFNNGFAGLDSYWDYGQPFSHIILIDSELKNNTYGVVFINTNFTMVNTSYDTLWYVDSNSFISRYWYQTFNIDAKYSHSAPHVMIFDSKNNSVYDGNQESITLTALEYVSTCPSSDCDETDDTKDYYTPYIINSTVIRYLPFSATFSFTGNSVHAIDMVTTMSPTGMFIADTGLGMGNLFNAVGAPLAYLLLVLGLIGAVVGIFAAIGILLRKSIK